MNDFKKLWETVSFENRKMDSETDKRIWNKIERRIKHPFRIYRYVYRMAAMILVLISLGIGYQVFLKADTYTAGLVSQQINLKDGSTVTLLPGAELTVKKSFLSATRDVYLEGNALFSVAKSKTHPFIVHGKDGYQIKVLGTVFRIIQEDTQLQVRLYEGKVAVQQPDDQNEIYLAPNESFSNYGKMGVAAVARFSENKGSKSDLEAVKSSDKLLSLRFNECTIKDAVEILENNYAVKIKYPQDKAQLRFSGTLNDEPLENIIQAMAFYLNLNVTNDNKTYILMP